MRIVLLGATAFVGSALLVEALHRGHKVTAIVRHPEKLEKRDGLTATAGDVYDTDSLASLIAGHDALISAFNPGWTPGTVKPEMYDEQVRGTSSIIAAASFMRKRSLIARVQHYNVIGKCRRGLCCSAKPTRQSRRPRCGSLKPAAQSHRFLRCERVGVSAPCRACRCDLAHTMGRAESMAPHIDIPVVTRDALLGPELYRAEIMLHQ
jgi:hypothetical protein